MIAVHNYSNVVIFNSPALQQTFQCCAVQQLMTAESGLWD